MGLPRLRFTVRRLMLVVAITGLAMGRGVWCYRMWELSREHASGARMHAYYWMVHSAADAIENATRADYHAAMARKYERAARYPWLPFKPNPPGP
jgi:hypothetical protein